MIHALMLGISSTKGQGKIRTATASARVSYPGLENESLKLTMGCLGSESFDGPEHTIAMG